MKDAPHSDKEATGKNNLLGLIATDAARDMGLPCVLITRLYRGLPAMRAFCIKGELRTHFDYRPSEHPCPYQRDGSDSCACGAAGQFPACLKASYSQDRAFLGQQLKTTDGRTLGHIAAFNHHPLPDPTTTCEKLQYHALCASAVLEREDATAEMAKILPALGMLSNMATRLLTLDAEALEGGIADIMAHVAHFFSAERACLYLLDDDGQRARLRYLWDDHGLWNDLPGEYFSCHRFPWLMSQLRDEQPVIVADSLALQETQARREAAILAQRGVHAFIDIPLFHRRQLNGFIGLDCQQAQPGWSLHAATVLNGVGHIMATALRERGQRRRLDNTEAQLQRLFEQFQEPLLIAAADHSIRHANRAAVSFFGYPRATLEGLSVSDLLPEDVRIPAQEETAVTTTARYSDGIEIPVALGVSTGNGPADDCLIAIHDLRPITQQQAIQTRELHHRLKNQLQGLTGLLQESGRHHPEIREVLRDSVSRIRTIALFNEQQLRPHAETQELAKLLRELATVIEQNYDVAIGIQISDSLGTRQIDPADGYLLGLVLNELLTNAAKHGHGGAIRLSCEPAPIAAYTTFLIENAAAEGLPADLDLVMERGLGQGLSLVMKLLPEGSTLYMEHRDAIVRARLTYAYVHLHGPTLFVDDTP